MAIERVGQTGLENTNTLEAINAMAHIRLYQDLFSNCDVEKEAVLV
jgi:hypothetical protein